MNAVLIQLLWVAAHHGLRQHGVRNSLPVDIRCECWRALHQLSAALGNPPAPGSR